MDLKEWGKMAWSILGIVLLTMFVMFLVGTAVHEAVKDEVKRHFKEVHHVECEH